MLEIKVKRHIPRPKCVEGLKKNTSNKNITQVQVYKDLGPGLKDTFKQASYNHNNTFETKIFLRSKFIKTWDRGWTFSASSTQNRSVLLSLPSTICSFQCCLQLVNGYKTYTVVGNMAYETYIGEVVLTYNIVWCI